MYTYSGCHCNISMYTCRFFGAYISTEPCLQHDNTFLICIGERRNEENNKQIKDEKG